MVLKIVSLQAYSYSIQILIIITKFWWTKGSNLGKATKKLVYSRFF